MNWVRNNFIPSIDYIVLSYFKDLFKDLFSIIVDKHAPIKKFQVKNCYSPGVTNPVLWELHQALSCQVDNFCHQGYEDWTGLWLS